LFKFNISGKTLSDNGIELPPREILQGGTRLLWGPGDRLRLLKIENLRFNKTTGKLS
jgi:hypothetical protein